MSHFVAVFLFFCILWGFSFAAVLKTIKVMSATSNIVAVLENCHDDRHKMSNLFVVIFTVFCESSKPLQNYLCSLKRKSCDSF